MAITADMLISDVLTARPGAVEVFERHGLGCAACLAAGMESLSAVATVHEVSVDALLTDLNDLAPDQSRSPRKES